jgi:predicted neutral ceramidase superfamily lipid hydrolase
MGEMEIFSAIIVVLSAVILILMGHFQVPLLVYQSTPERFLIFSGVWFLLFILLGILSPFVFKVDDSGAATSKRKMDILSEVVWLVIAIYAVWGLLDGVVGKDLKSFIQTFYPFGGLLILRASRFTLYKFFLDKRQGFSTNEGKRIV